MAALLLEGFGVYGLEPAAALIADAEAACGIYSSLNCPPMGRSRCLIPSCDVDPCAPRSDGPVSASVSWFECDRIAPDHRLDEQGRNLLSVREGCDNLNGAQRLESLGQ